MPSTNITHFTFWRKGQEIRHLVLKNTLNEYDSEEFVNVCCVWLYIDLLYSETSLIRHSMGLEKIHVGPGDCWSMEYAIHDYTSQDCWIIEVLDYRGGVI